MKHDATAALKMAADPVGRGKHACGKKPPKLTDDQREYIVRRLAAYERPSRIRHEVRERFGIEISPTAIDHYDPTRRAKCGRRWADLFYAARRAHAGSRSDEATRNRKVERLVLRTVEIVADRILNGVLAEAQHFATDAGEITDEDRLRALLAFIERLKISHHPGIAEIRRALFEDIDPQGAEAALSAAEAAQSGAEAALSAAETAPPAA
jgi:hypothetical protein